jgi:hypothetical protein
MVNDPEGAVLLEAGMAASRTGQPRLTPRRRPLFFRVSVRGLLLLVLVIGCGLGWIVQFVRAGQAQRRAVAAIYQAGGWVVYDTVWDEDQNTSTWKARWPRWLVDQLGVDYFGNAVFINLDDRGTDDVLTHVEKLKHLKQLHRPGLAVTDAGLAHLGRLSELRLLSLDDTRVTNAGLAHLKGLSGLKWLKLSRTRVTAAGVADLQKSLPHLQAIR